MGRHKDKFHDRAIKAILVGCARSHKAYKLYDLVDRSFVSRDVIFHEKVFPFEHGVDLEQTILPLPVIDLDSQPYTTIPLATTHTDQAHP